MSIIFGIRQAEGHSIHKQKLHDLACATDRWAPDGTFVQVKGRIGMGFQPYHTHERSNLESQPVLDDFGNMATLDGRLDNHKELRELLDIQDPGTADSKIILAAFMRWGEECFAKFVGDWALVIWLETERSLYLARDHAGARTLYYQERDGCLLWATFLETFFAEDFHRDIDVSYAASYLVGQSTGARTPFDGIRAVSAAHYFKFVEVKQTRVPHWTWTLADNIRYRNGDDYRHQFFTLFETSIERRTGPGSSILAELSGGMDSSAIVCTSDYLRKKYDPNSPDLLDTVSYYDQSEPNWDEAPYFSTIEQRRGKEGIHLYLPLLDEGIAPSPIPSLWPGQDRTTFQNECRLLENTSGKDYRIVLSGLGGDELLGGVPDPLPELADSIASGNLIEYARQCLSWCLSLRRPFLHMSVDVARFTLRQYRGAHFDRGSLPPWISDELCSYIRHASYEDPISYRPSEHLPSQIANGRVWWRIGETLPHRCPGCYRRHEYRYPFLDRDLVDFLLRVPRKQLLQPGRRRSLMRDALKGIVPDKILARRRKANRSTSVLSSLRSGLPILRELLRNSGAEDLGLVDPVVLREAIPQVIQKGDLSLIHSVTRFVLFELWYRQHYSRRDCLARTL